MLSSNEVDRFMAKVRVDHESGCWIWIAARWPDGYGAFRSGDRKVRAHRWSYVHHKGPIPDGLILDHLCRNPSCVNPYHLEAVTHQTNTLRGIGPAAIHAKKTHCDHGHEFTPENTYRGKFGRSCRRCQADSYDSPETAGVRMRDLRQELPSSRRR